MATFIECTINLKARTNDLSIKGNSLFTFRLCTWENDLARWIKWQFLSLPITTLLITNKPTNVLQQLLLELWIHAFWIHKLVVNGSGTDETHLFHQSSYCELENQRCCLSLHLLCHFYCHCHDHRAICLLYEWASQAQFILPRFLQWMQCPSIKVRRKEWLQWIYPT